MFGTNLYSAVNCTSLCSAIVVMLSMLLLLTATLRIAKSSEKLFGTFGRDGWDHDPLIRAVIKNRGKSFSRRTSLALWSRNLWSRSDNWHFMQGTYMAKKVGFPQMATIHSLPNPHGYGQCRAPLFAFAPRRDILAMCIIIIIVSLSPLVCAASPPRHRRL